MVTEMAPEVFTAAPMLTAPSEVIPIVPVVPEAPRVPDPVVVTSLVLLVRIPRTLLNLQNSSYRKTT